MKKISYTATSNLFTGVAHAEKYQSNNWISQKLIKNFMLSIISFVKETNSIEIYEIGCGEGHILGVLAAEGFKVRGCDISTDSLAVAKSEALKRGLKIPFAVKSIYDLDPKIDSSDTVICCEVLEHLTDPHAGIQKLISITRKDLIVSVPHEPIWRLLNMVRGKYLAELGNTPGHLQHWSWKQFVEFVNQYAEVVKVKKPLPWTLVHCKPR